MGGCTSTPIDWDEEVWLGHFSLGNAIGKGGFTRVKLVEYKRTKETYALKFMDKKAIVARKSAKNYIQERKILEQLDHPYITNLRWAFQDDKYLYFVLDLMMGGDLRFHHDRKWCPGEPAIKLWVAQIACAIAYLHSKKIIHRDLKIDNILLDLQGHAHITDFNCATWIDPASRHFQLTGTRRYMAPEMVSRDGYDWQIDYWALGMIAFEMLFSDIPFANKAKNEEALFYSIMHDELAFPPNADKICSREGQDFIRGLLQKDPRNRLGCRSLRRGRQDIRDHSWFSNIDWQKLETRQIPSAFIPNPEKLNFNISHELDEFMAVDKPLTQGRRRKQGRNIENLDKQEQVMEEQFTVFDYTKARRDSYTPQRTVIVNTEPGGYSETVMVSLPVSLAPSRSPSRPGSADPTQRPMTSQSFNPPMTQVPPVVYKRPATAGSHTIDPLKMRTLYRSPTPSDIGTADIHGSVGTSLTYVTSRNS